MCEFCNHVHDVCPVIVVASTIGVLLALACIAAIICSIGEYFSELNAERNFMRNDMKAAQKSIMRLNKELTELRERIEPTEDEEPQEETPGRTAVIGRCRVKIRVR